ncbi:hypothetical protein GSI_09985 [Ganoderma sinense ZZ0214-1]|uniref:Protein kinase domain-containing protein n=1 Tax=Ganoderma sinense ZZ0214-1 TaxID=1077348 RepID=A0A2G8S2E9_9APHY|nr:hypothetical protein GSI_09985 [Ganoderma sinense ZZ0214-1]
MYRLSLLERIESIWHRFKCVPVALKSPYPPVNSPLYPKGPDSWLGVGWYNTPALDLSPSAQLLAFQPGHLLTLGGDQYRIHRKLRGQATSSVWLAEHTVRGHVASRRRFVALETFNRLFSLATALEVRKEPRSPTTDLNYIRNITASQDRALPGAECCDRVRAVFLPDRHLYAVKDPTGPTVWDLQLAQPKFSFSLAVTKRIIGDTLRALKYIHSFGRTAVGVAPHNMLVTHQCSSDSLSANIVQFLQSHPPETIDPKPVDSEKSSTSTAPIPDTASPTPETPAPSPGKIKTKRKTKHKPVAIAAPPPPKPSTTKPKNVAAVLKAQPLPAFGLSPNFDNIQVRLTRCEHATLEKRLHERQGDRPAKLAEYAHAELLIAAPEVLRGAPERWAPPVNIWSLGNQVFQFLTGNYLFDVHKGPNGPRLPDWIELVIISSPPTRFLEMRLRSHEHAVADLSEADVRQTCAFILRCLEMDPAKRATAAELLEDEWFRT